MIAEALQLCRQNDDDTVHMLATCGTRLLYACSLQLCACSTQQLAVMLQGANNISLEGVFHSISRKGTFADCSQLVWYGSDDVVDAWLHALV